MEEKHQHPEIELEVGTKVRHIERGILGTIIKKRGHEIYDVETEDGEIIRIREENLEEV